MDYSTHELATIESPGPPFPTPGLGTYKLGLAKAQALKGLYDLDEIRAGGIITRRISIICDSLGEYLSRFRQGDVGRESEQEFCGLVMADREEERF